MVSDEVDGALPGPTPVPTLPPVDERAKNISLTPSRKRRDMVGASNAAAGQRQQVDVDEATPKRPRWNSQGRVATATDPIVRSKLKQGDRSLRRDLFQEFSATSDKQVVYALFQKYGSDPSFACHLVNDIVCPSSYQEALKSLQFDDWKVSMHDEIHVLWHKRQCWEVVPVPKGVRILRCHFVYKKVKYKDGKVDRLKSRLVVDGSQQKVGVDYKETFAPVVKYTSVRMFLAICSVFKMYIHQLDVKNAFIYAPLDEDVYVWPHPEMKVQKGHCIKLLRSLYGLRQAPRNWNAYLHKFIHEKIGLTRTPQDYCLYYGLVDGHLVFVAVFVDDILIACANLDILCQVKKSFCKSFEMTDLGLAKEFLGIRITQDAAGITIDQSSYVDKLLDKYSKYIVPTRNYSGVPMKKGHIFRGEAPSTEKQLQFVEEFPYAEAVGAVLYLSVITRIDIAYSVGVLTRHMKKPTFEAC